MINKVYDISKAHYYFYKRLEVLKKSILYANNEFLSNSFNDFIEELSRIDEYNIENDSYLGFAKIIQEEHEYEVSEYLKFDFINNDEINEITKEYKKESFKLVAEQYVRKLIINKLLKDTFADKIGSGYSSELSSIEIFKLACEYISKKIKEKMNEYKNTEDSEINSKIYIADEIKKLELKLHKLWKIIKKHNQKRYL